VVITAHYTYATTSDGTHLYIKKHVTAVIDYAPVTTFCSELLQTLGLHSGSQFGPGWLSGADLENRLCIAGMTSGSIHISAWVVDGDFTLLKSQARQVDPSNFLYSDKWNHM
jgi:hypothetical protein